VRLLSRPPSLVVTLELEGPLRFCAVCETYEEAERLALDVLNRDDSLEEAVRAWAEAVLFCAPHHRRAT
jgi:hypothetical protein